VSSIRARLLAALLAAMAVVTLLGTYAIYVNAREAVDELFDYQLRQLALSLRDQALHRSFAPPAETVAEDFDFVIQVWNPDGVRVYFSQPHRTLPGLAQLGYASITTPDGEWRVFATRLGEAIIQVAQPMRVRNAMALNAATRVLVPAFALLPALSVLIWLIVGKGLSPLKKLARAVSRRSAQALDPLPVARVPQEVLPVICALNDLLARLDAALTAQRAFVADAAHELRTPIAALQLQVQLMERAGCEAERAAAIADLKAGVRRASRAVQQLLTLARQGSSAESPALQEFDLGELARSVIAGHAVLAAEKAIDLGYTGHEGEVLNLCADAAALQVLLENLVGNAIRYSPHGGHVDISVSRHPAGNIVLEVSDNGPGIPPAERERVFDRFYRGTTTEEPGSGLGLAIVRAIAERHRAKLELGDSQTGGLRVRVTFPQTKPQAHFKEGLSLPA
jgi:two-component system OmpR family sensor kinase